VGPLIVVVPAHQDEDVLAMQVTTTFDPAGPGLDPAVHELLIPPDGWSESAAVVEQYRRFRVFTRKADSNATPNPSMTRVSGPATGAATVFAARAYSFVGARAVTEVTATSVYIPPPALDQTVFIDTASFAWTAVQPTITAGNVAPVDPGTLTWTGVDVTTSTGSGLKFLRLPGLTGAVAQVPDSAALGLTNSHSIYMRISVPTWTPPAPRIFLTKWGTAGQLSYYWELRTGGEANIQWTSNGSTIANQQTVGGLSGRAVNAFIWVRLSFVGATRISTVAWAPDATLRPSSGWTVLGTSGGGSASGTFFDSTQPLTIGSLTSADYRNALADFAQIEIVNDLTATTVFTLDPNNYTTGTDWVTNTGQTVTLLGSAIVTS
jgi:hypothetical protein